MVSEKARDAAAGECSMIEDVMAVLGRAWAGAVLQAILDGNERFTDIARAIPGVTDTMLSARLRELGARGLVRRDVEPGPPVSISYRLTAAGRDAAPVLDAIRDFGRAHPEVVDPASGPRPDRARTNASSAAAPAR